MKWETVTLYKRTVSGTDKLGNAVSTHSLLKTCDGRITPWTAEEINIDRNITKNELKLILKLPFWLYSHADVVQVNGIDYEVEKEEEMGTRFTLLHVKDYKNVKK